MTATYNTSISTEAILYMAETYQVHATVMHELLPLSINLESNELTATDTLKTLTTYFYKFINGLCKIIEFAINKIKALFKIFSARAKDVQMGNADFIAKYGPRLERISYAKVNYEGFNMGTEITSMGNEIGLISGANYSDLKMIILDNRKVFNSPDDIDEFVSKNRFAILSSNQYITNTKYLSDEAFKNELYYKYYGRKGHYMCDVHSALDVIKGFRIQYENAKRINDLAIINGNNDIKEIEKLKSIFKSRTISGRLGIAKDDLVEQLVMLSKYRTQTLNDSINAFGVILKYIDDANLQAKSICIKALQEN